MANKNDPAKRLTPEDLDFIADGTMITYRTVATPSSITLITFPMEEPV